MCLLHLLVSSLVALVTGLDTWFSLQLVLIQLRSGKSVLLYSGFSGITPFPLPCVFAAVEWGHRDVLTPQVELRQGLIQVLQGRTHEHWEGYR